MEDFNNLLKKALLKDYVPKKDVQQNEFLKKYPEFDGRGIKIAIIDSVVDLSLSGMQKTSTGLPKIIDCFDFTDNGNVDTSVIRKSGDDNTLTLLSGREISIPSNWKNPLNEWHLGKKFLQEIFPTVFEKMEEKEKLNENDIQKCPRFVDKIVAEKLSDNYNIDFIVWTDGKKWQACVIPSFLKHVENAKILTNFHDEHEFCYLLDDISCGIRIEKGGNFLKLLIPCHDHGTYVAQVAAAHFPNEPEKDGLAPGAQIFSINFMGGNVNVSTIKKALNKCIELGVDIVNLSVSFPQFEKSSILTLLKKMVNEHKIIVTKSAGNEGPFFTSIRNANFASADEVFTIGSIFTSNINSIFEKAIGRHLPFMSFYSSKGPLSSGSRGITLTAPADVIVETPKWHPSKKVIISGTSFAAPNVAGSIACLLSALKANSIEYTPATIKLALSNTAFLPDENDRLGFGNGIIQINSAFEYFKTFATNLPKIVFPKLFLNETFKNGITIYKTKDNQNVYDYCINVTNLNISTKKQVSWVLKLMPSKHRHIEYSKMVSKNLKFKVKIHTNALKPGSINYSEIQGFDSKNLFLGPIFHLPITVIVPEKVVDYRIERKVFVEPPSKYQNIILPPENCMKCTIKLINSENDKIEFENSFEKYKRDKNNFIFVPNGSICPWEIAIQWEKIFEIYIYQTIFIEKGIDLKAHLEINFEKD